jgi:hypothetical protein
VFAQAFSTASGGRKQASKNCSQIGLWSNAAWIEKLSFGN